MRNKLITRSIGSLCLALGLSACINDAEVLPKNNSGFVDEGEGNVRFAFVVPNSFSTKAGEENAETSGIYETGNANEYNVKSLVVYLFNSETKGFYKKISLENITRVPESPQVPENNSSNIQSEHLVQYTANRVLIDPGTYDVFAIANGDVRGSFGTEDEFINLVDKTTYSNGVKEIDGTLLMTNRGDNSGLYEDTPASNLKVTVSELLSTEKPTLVTLNLERVMAKVMIGKSKAAYSLLNDKNQEYVSINLSGCQYINLSRWFYTFRHTAVLSNAGSQPSSYSIAGGNFGEINPTNGYVIDPYFFSKTKEAAATFDNTDNYYIYPLKTVTDSWQDVPQDSYHSFYCLENCMFKTAQLNAYSTGIRFRASFTPKTVWGEDQQASSDRPDQIYYANYKFYTSIQAMKNAGLQLTGITEGSSDEELAKFSVKRYKKGSDNSIYFCYYNYWIRHLDNKKDNEMGVMEFAIVRNNIYRLFVTNIAGLGSGTSETEPGKPDEYEAYLKMDFNVLPWIVRNQGGDGGATLK